MRWVTLEWFDSAIAFKTNFKRERMFERKYRYQRPRDHEQRLEAVYEELSSSPVENKGRFRPTETLKDHVVALLAQLKHENSQRKDKEEAKSSDVVWAQGMLAALAIGCLGINFSGGATNFDWLDQHLFAIRLWGVGLAAIFLGVSIERTSFFRVLWSFGLTKLVASFALSALIIFSTGKASGAVNALFPVDASAVPFTRAIVAGIFVFKYAYPLLLIVGVFALVHALRAAIWFKKKLAGKDDYTSAPLISIAFLLLSIAVFSYGSHWMSRDFSEEAIPAKVYRLAHLLDFNARYECSNIPRGQAVVFLGPDQARVLVDEGSVETNEIESFVNAAKSGDVAIPKRFYVAACDLPSSLAPAERKQSQPTSQSND